jgi:hypothetical protein
MQAKSDYPGTKSGVLPTRPLCTYNLEQPTGRLIDFTLGRQVKRHLDSGRGSCNPAEHENSRFRRFQESHRQAGLKVPSRSLKVDNLHRLGWMCPNQRPESILSSSPDSPAENRQSIFGSLQRGHIGPHGFTRGTESLAARTPPR